MSQIKVDEGKDELECGGDGRMEVEEEAVDAVVVPPKH